LLLRKGIGTPSSLKTFISMLINRSDRFKKAAEAAAQGCQAAIVRVNRSMILAFCGATSAVVVLRAGFRGRSSLPVPVLEDAHVFGGS